MGIVTHYLTMMKVQVPAVLVLLAFFVGCSFSSYQHIETKRNDCHTVYDDVSTPQCRTAYEQECTQEYENQCRTEYSQECNTEYDNQCKTEYTDECTTEYSVDCRTNYRQECTEEYGSPSASSAYGSYEQVPRQ